ncbi:EamA family transporter [Lacimicrobium alkaliphilum]|nr:DMT family transporter [Lacimicrobium alkaliphilum]
MATLFVVLAALCWGLSGGIAAILMDKGWNPNIIALYRGAVGLVFVLIWLTVRPQGNGLTSIKLWAWASIAGLGVAGNFVFFFISIAHGGVAVAATLMYSAPVFVYIASFFLRFESATPMKWAAIAVVMTGIVLLTGIYDIRASAVTPVSVGAGLLSGLFYAVFIFGFKSAAPHGSPQAILTIAFSLLAAILIWPANIDNIIAVIGSQVWWLFILLGILGAGVSFILYIAGLNYTAPAVASVVAMVEPVVASLFGVLILNEHLDALQLCGMALILVAVTTLSIYSNARRFSFRQAN